jgi:hypothetical protein
MQLFEGISKKRNGPADHILILDLLQWNMQKLLGAKLDYKEDNEDLSIQHTFSRPLLQVTGPNTSDVLHVRAILHVSFTVP